MEIGKLFTAIGLSVQQAQEILSLQDVERYMRYFKKKDSESVLPNENNTALYPKAIRFSLKSKEKKQVHRRSPRRNDIPRNNRAQAG